MKKLFLIFTLFMMISMSYAVEFTVELHDSYGDGWNGGSLDLLVNGTVVLDDITIPDGAGPDVFAFDITDGDMVSTVYTAGSWASENYYYIYDNAGTEIASDGVGGVEPTGLDPFEVFASTAPSAPSNPQPENGAFNVMHDGTLTWDFGDDTETYDLKLGPAGEMVTVEAGLTAGATGSYTYSDLEPMTNYEWQVIAYNSERAVTEGPIWNFQTKPSEGYVFEGFENGFPPEGWTNDGWTSTTYSPFEGEMGAYTYNDDTRLFTPLLNVENGDSLKFYAKNSSYSGGELAIQWSSDGQNWTNLVDSVALTGEYQEFSYELTGVRGLGYIAFYCQSSYAYLDNIVYPEPLQYVPIYDVQYVENPEVNDSSSYEGQNIAVQGIVTGNNYGGNFFMSDPEGGPWNGIYVYNPGTMPNVGDQVTVIGDVVEYFGFTEISNPDYVIIASSGNPVPEPDIITTGEVNQEMYESCLVSVKGASVTAEPNTYGEWYVDDGSARAECQIDDGFDAYYSSMSVTEIGSLYGNITGIVDYGYGEFAINPLNQNYLALALDEMPFLQNFEDELSDYEYLQGDQIEISSDDAYMGSSSLELGVADSVAYEGNNTLKYFIQIPDTRDPVYVDFAVLRYYDASYSNEHNAYIKNLDESETLETIYEGDYEDESWQTYSIDVSSYAGQIVVLVIEQKDDSSLNGSNTYFDEFRVHGPLPIISVAPNSFEFGDVQQGDVALDTLTIYNTGDGNLEIDNVLSSNPDVFSLTFANREVNIGAGDSLNVLVEFNPADTIDYNETITIISNDVFANPPFGNGTVLNVSGAGVEPFAIFNTETTSLVYFKEINETATQSFTVTNEGMLPMDMDMSFASRDWSVDPSSVTGLENGEEQEINITYTAPSQNMVDSNALNITTNEPMLPAGEKFTGWPAETPQNGWQVIDNEGSGRVWRFDNPGGRTINTTSASGGFAIIDSDYFGSGGSEDCDLISPILDLSDFTNVTFEFEHYFNAGYGGYGDVQYSVDGGTTWEILESWESSDTDNAQLESYDLTAEASGNNQVQFKFHWTGSWSWYWAVDDVVVYDNTARSITDPEPQVHAVNLKAYTVEPFDSTNTDLSNYRAVNSVSASRETDVPEFEWVDNVSTENLFDWQTENKYFLNHDFNYLGNEIDSIAIPTYDYYGTLYLKTGLILENELFRNNFIKTKKPNGSAPPNIENIECMEIKNDNPFRNDIETDMNVSLAPGLLFGGVYISEEEFGTVITWAVDDFFKGQIILAKSGDIILNYKEIDNSHAYFQNPDFGIGIRNADFQLKYGNTDWEFSNIKPEMAVRIFPAYDDTAPLPETMTLLEDIDGINNDNDTHWLDVADYIPTGGEILSVSVTGSEHITLSVEGNEIGITPDLDWSGEEQIGYNITARMSSSQDEIRLDGTIDITVENVNDVPMVVNPIPDILPSDELMEDFGQYLYQEGDLPSQTSDTNIFYDPDSDLNYDLTLSTQDDVELSIEAESFLFESIENAYNYKVDPNTGEVVFDQPLQVIVTATEMSAARREITNKTRNKLTREAATVSDTFYVSIVQVNDAPEALAIPEIEMYEDPQDPAELDLAEYFIDVDDDPMTYTYSGNTNINIEIDGDMATFSPLENWNGAETITITADDGIDIRSSQLKFRTKKSSRESVNSSVDVTVLPVNDAPYVLGDAMTSLDFDEDTTDSNIILSEIFDDVDLDPELNAEVTDFLTYSYEEMNNLTVEIDGENVILTPNENWNGTEVLTLIAEDSFGETQEHSIDITVNPVNDAPTINLPDSFTFNEGGSFERNFNQYVNDVDGDDLTLSASGNDEVIVDIDGLNVEFSTDDPMFFGQEVITFTVDDGVSRTRSRRATRVSASDDIEINVTYINHSPEYNGPTNVNVDEDFEPYNIGNMDEMTDDYDIPKGHTEISYEIASYNENKLSAYINEDNDLMIESILNENGLVTIEIEISDNDTYTTPKTTTANITVDIASVNDLPYFEGLPETIEMAANSIQYLNLEDNIFDVDDVPELDITSPEGFVEVTQISGYDYRFRLNASGIYGIDDNITLILDDGHGEEVLDSIMVSVAESEPPYVTYMIPTQYVDEDFAETEVADLDECFSDPDDPQEDMVYSVDVQPAGEIEDPISASIDENNMFSIESNVENWFGQATVRVSCSDGHDRYTVYQDVIVEVESVNDLPVLLNEIDDQFVDEDDFSAYTPIDLTTIFADPDGDPLNYELVFNDTEIEVSIDNDMLYLDPVQDWNGTTEVTVKAGDGISPQLVLTSFIVDITPVHDYPEFEPGLDGMEFLIDGNGEIVDFDNYIDTHGENNSIPINFGSTEYYDVSLAGDYGIYALDILPTGYQWGYPDEECTLSLEGGDEVTVTFVTNDAPYLVVPIADISELVTEFPVSGINLDLHFDDLVCENLNYSAVYNETEVDITIDDNMLTVDCADPVYYGTTQVTIIASDTEARASVSDNFNVTIESGALARERVTLKSGEEYRENLNRTRKLTRLNIANDEEGVARLEDDELVIGRETEEIVKERITLNSYNYETGKTTKKEYEILIVPDNTIEETTILGNYPNPFSLSKNGTTRIEYSLKHTQNLELSIYNILGQKIITLDDGIKEKGIHSVTWNGKDKENRNVSSGIYFYKLKSKKNIDIQKLIIVK